MTYTFPTDLKDIIYNGETGVVTVDYKYGGQAKIFLEEGLIEGIMAEKTTGSQAAKICTRWISVTTYFSKQPIDLPSGIKNIETNTFLSALEKVAATMKKINAQIPSHDANYKIDMAKLGTNDQFSSQELRVALLLDGSRSVEEVILESNRPELEVLVNIYKLNTLGIAQIFTSHHSMEKEDRDAFFSSLKNTLSDLVGPVADVLIENALSAIDITPDSIMDSDIPKLIETIGADLGDEERLSLAKLIGDQSKNE